jgi:transcriptional regulator with XRE-family HTH domain
VPTDQTREAISVQVVRLLREERQRQQISMTMLAQRSGLSQTMISFVERDLRNPTLESLLRMADALGVNLGDVIKQAYRLAGRR